METSIEKLLTMHYTDDVFNTHVSLIKPKGKFRFDRKSLDNFMNVYCEELYQNPELIVGVAEKPLDYIPVLVDIDIKVEEDYLTDTGYEYERHVYNDSHLNQVIMCYQSMLQKVIEDCKEEHLYCAVFEKSGFQRYTVGEKTFLKSGFHLSFYNTFMKRQDQEIHLIPRVKEEVKALETFSDLGFVDSSSVIDNAVCKVHWLLYGSRKDESKEPYLLTKIIDNKGNELDIDKTLRSYRIYDLDGTLIRINGDVRKYLPRIFSIIINNREHVNIKRNLPIPAREKILQEREEKSKKKKHRANDLTDEQITALLDETEKLLPLLDDFRAEDRNEWMTIGWALHSIGNGCQRALEQWLDFSSRCDDKYDEAHCIFEWERMTRTDYTIGTIKYYASVDSPKEYAEYKKQILDKHARDALNGSHYDIAKILYEEYGTKFVCASISNKTWYQFTGNFWEEIEEGVGLRVKISNEIVERFGNIANEALRELISHGGDPKSPESVMYDKKLAISKKIMQQLKSSCYKNNVMREACDIFYDKNFKNKLDQNPYLIGFKNGIYDLNTNVFRIGRPEDYVSKHMPIEYKEFREDDEHVIMVKDFLEKVFPDTSVRKFFLDNVSDLFVGGNFQKTIIFWTGHGDNSKSVTQKIIESMFGQLAIKFPTTLFSQKKITNGAADPTLARAAPPVRLATLEEPDNDESLNIGLIKSLTGNDSYFARDLFEKGKQTREVTPMFKIYFITNKLPKLKYSDQAVWNRVRVLPFESTFVRPGEPCPDSYEEQLRQKRFPMDRDFAKKIPLLLEPFAWYLLEHRKTITTRIEPPKVLEATAIYQRQNDIYRQFVEEMIIEDSRSKLSLVELYNIFKNWFKESFTTYNCPSKNDVKESFDKLFGDSVRQVWSGYRVKNLTDEQQAEEQKEADISDLF